MENTRSMTCTVQVLFTQRSPGLVATVGDVKTKLTNQDPKKPTVRAATNTDIPNH